MGGPPDAAVGLAADPDCTGVGGGQRRLALCMTSGLEDGEGLRRFWGGAGALTHTRRPGGIGDLPAVCSPPPLTQRLSRSEARGPAASLRKTGEERGRQGDGLAGRDRNSHYSWYPARASMANQRRSVWRWTPSSWATSGRLWACPLARRSSRCRRGYWCPSCACWSGGLSSWPSSPMRGRDAVPGLPSPPTAVSRRCRVAATGTILH
jgi:hypothetical protein